jgi:hypothetical protein
MTMIVGNENKAGGDLLPNAIAQAVVNYNQ